MATGESRAAAQGQAMFLPRKTGAQRGETVKDWSKRLNIILLQAHVEATFKYASVLSGCRITWRK